MYLNKINLFLVISICLIFFFLTYEDVKSSKIEVIDGIQSVKLKIKDKYGLLNEYENEFEYFD